MRLLFRLTNTASVSEDPTRKAVVNGWCETRSSNIHESRARLSGLRDLIIQDTASDNVAHPLQLRVFRRKAVRWSRR